MDMNRATSEWDLVVVGGGPGGSTVATLVAMQGYRVALLEKARFPRHQVGESLIPATVHGVCRLLGVTDKLEAAGFVRKNGAGFRWGTNRDTWHIRFTNSSALSQIGASYAYQVPRAEFDKILLDNAKSCGVNVLEETACTGVDLSDAGPRRVHHARDGRSGTLQTKYIVDASGHASPIARRVGARIHSSFFRNFAVFAYFEGGSAQPEPFQGNILCEAFDEGWMWHIPLSVEEPQFASVGAVVAREHAGRLKEGTEAALLSFVARCPTISALLAGASRVRNGMYGEVRVRRDWSYTTDRLFYGGLSLVGDAACFIDPVLSTGVHLASYAGVAAARSINSCLSGELTEQVAFGEFERRYRLEFELFFNYLVAFYDMHRNESSYFWEARKLLHTDEPEAEAFVRLLAGGASDASAYFESRRGLGDILGRYSTALVRASDERTAEALTGDLAKELAFHGRSPDDVAAVARGLTDREHLLGVRSSPSDRPPIGLVPSSDGLRWVQP